MYWNYDEYIESLMEAGMTMAEAIEAADEKLRNDQIDSDREKALGYNS